MKLTQEAVSELRGFFCTSHRRSDDLMENMIDAEAFISELEKDIDRICGKEVETVNIPIWCGCYISIHRLMDDIWGHCDFVRSGRREIDAKREKVCEEGEGGS